MKSRKTGFLAVLLSITAVLTILGCFILLSVTANKLIRHLEDNIVMVAYFSRSAPESAIKECEAKLKMDSRFSKIELISNTESAQLFEQELGEDYIQKLGENPLPWSIKLYLDPKATAPSDIQEIVESVQATEYIYEVDFQQGTAQLIASNKRKIALFLGVLSLVLLGLAILLIHNSIKLQIFSDRFKVKSMQLVGATEAFIQAPYLKKAAVQAVLAALIAAILASGLYQLLKSQLANFDSINIPLHFSDIRIYSLLFVTLLISGMLISLSSAYLASKKFLRSKIDELY